jgi:hypothetical protein
LRSAWFSASTYPAIGPDVTGGDVSGLGGHVFKIPARLCFETTPSVGGILTYNSANCYAAGGSAPCIAVGAELRLALRRFLEPTFPRLSVVSFQEIPGTYQIENAGIISAPVETARAAA